MSVTVVLLGPLLGREAGSVQRPHTVTVVAGCWARECQGTGRGRGLHFPFGIGAEHFVGRHDIGRHGHHAKT